MRAASKLESIDNHSTASAAMIYRSQAKICHNQLGTVAAFTQSGRETDRHYKAAKDSSGSRNHSPMAIYKENSTITH